MSRIVTLGQKVQACQTEAELCELFSRAMGFDKDKTTKSMKTKKMLAFTMLIAIEEDLDDQNSLLKPQQQFVTSSIAPEDSPIGMLLFEPYIPQDIIGEVLDWLAEDDVLNIQWITKSAYLVTQPYIQRNIYSKKQLTIKAEDLMIKRNCYIEKYIKPRKCVEFISLVIFASCLRMLRSFSEPQQVIAEYFQSVGFCATC